MYKRQGIAYGGDREASPKMQEVKFNYQNITAKVSEDKVTVINKNLFVNTDIYTAKVTLAKDGKVICTKPLATAVAPLSEETYDLPIAKQERPGEYTVTVSFHLKEDTVWAKAGHEVAFGQYVYQVEKEPVVCTDEIEIIRSTHNIGIRGAHFEEMCIRDSLR